MYTFDDLNRPLGSPPEATSLSVTKVMKANRAKNTGPELSLRRALFKRGLRGYRLHWKKAPGRPDIAFPGARLAVFVYGCFWHRCPICKLPLPKSNIDFWRRKFLKNQERDKRKHQELEANHWQVISIWECQIKSDVGFCVERIRAMKDKHGKEGV